MRFKNMLILLTILIQFAATKIVPGNGTFMFNGIFPEITEEESNTQSGLMMIEAMKYAIKTINEDPSLLHGYKLDIKNIYTVNQINDVRQKILTTFKEKVPFLIGPYSSETSYIGSILTGTFSQITISYGATYSDFDTNDHTHEYMLRTVPSDKFRIQVALDLVKNLKWNYLAVISSYSYDGESDARHFIAKLPTIGVCLAEKIDLPNSPTLKQYEKTMDALITDKEKRLKGVILFTNKKDTQEIFSIIKKQLMYKRFVFICIYGCTNYAEIIEGAEDILNGTLSIDIAYKEMPGFEAYFTNLEITENSDSYFKKAWQRVFNCSLSGDDFRRKKCTGKEKFSRGVGYYPNTPVQTVMDAVYAVADAIHVYLSYVCQDTMIWMQGKDSCVLDTEDRKMYSSHVYQMLVRMSYTDGTLEDFKVPYSRIPETVEYDIHQLIFNNGSSKNILRASWSLNRPELHLFPDEVLLGSKPEFDLKYNNETDLAPIITCSDECPPGYIRINDLNLEKEKCCWSCKRCPWNSISVNNTCVKCKYTENVDFEKNLCKTLPEIHLYIGGQNLLLILLLFSIIGICLLLFFTTLFIYHIRSKIMKRCGKDLFFLILLGIGMLFLCPIPFMVYPSMLVCIFRGALPGMAFLICYAPLFLRISRIYRIFIYAKQSVYSPVLISVQSHVIAVLAIICVQMIVAGIWFTEKTPMASFILTEKGDYISFQCSGNESPVSMFINLTLSFIFMVSCTILAFKTRHFPKNYNEAKFIGVTLYITCVLWAVFLPTYYLTTGKGIFLREYLLSTLCITIGFVNLFGLFGQKVRLLMFPRNQDQDANNPKTWSISHSNESQLLESKTGNAKL
ncbi:metabotropic glutamate receptor 3 isoform X1 [Hydra vulgaris]|uniref:metabotropic glutamate receptor 3 isoform X1 n=1 Tax=Hydra vulgaris TaxID=6087 RepID=UPI001F5EF59A|nr:metabotropic glutamate receptor 3 [Hydra vulgaris]